MKRYTDHTTNKAFDRYLQIVIEDKREGVELAGRSRVAEFRRTKKEKADFFKSTEFLVLLVGGRGFEPPTSTV